MEGARGGWVGAAERGGGSGRGAGLSKRRDCAVAPPPLLGGAGPGPGGVRIAARTLPGGVHGKGGSCVGMPCRAASRAPCPNSTHGMPVSHAMPRGVACFAHPSRLSESNLRVVILWDSDGLGAAPSYAGRGAVRPGPAPASPPRPCRPVGAEPARPARGSRCACARRRVAAALAAQAFCTPALRTPRPGPARPGMCGGMGRRARNACRRTRLRKLAGRAEASNLSGHEQAQIPFQLFSVDVISGGEMFLECATRVWQAFSAVGNGSSPLCSRDIACCLQSIDFIPS